jgi:hypothetical protein
LALLKVGVDPLLWRPSSSRAFLLLHTTPLWYKDLLLACLLAVITKIFKWIFERGIPAILLSTVYAQLAPLTVQQVPFARVLPLSDIFLSKTGATGAESTAPGSLRAGAGSLLYLFLFADALDEAAVRLTV